MVALASEEKQLLLEREAKCEAIEAKEAEVLRLIMVAAAEGLASGEMAATDPEFVAVAARGERTALALLRRTAESLDALRRQAADHAATPGGEPVAQALRKHADVVAALRSRAEEFAEFMRVVAGLPPPPTPDVAVGSDAGSDSAAGVEPAAGRRPAAAAAARPRRRNAKYYGPEWAN